MGKTLIIAASIPNLFAANNITVSKYLFSVLLLIKLEVSGSSISLNGSSGFFFKKYKPKNNTINNKMIKIIFDFFI